MRQETYKKIEVKRKKIYRKVLALLISGLLCLLIGIVFAILGLTLDDKFLDVFLAIGLVLIIISIIILIIKDKKEKKFLADFKNIVVRDLGKDIFEDFTYEAEKKIDKKVINNTGMVRRPDSYNGADLIKGSYKDIEFEVSDVNLEEVHSSSGPDGTLVTTTYTILKGRWYIYRFPKRFDGTIKIVEGKRNKKPYKTKGLTKVETESLEFNKKFNSFASDEKYFFYQITPLIMDRLIAFEKAHGGQVMMYFNENELHIGVNDKKDYFEIKLKTKITEKNISHFIDDITIIKDIMEEFRLVGDKFSNVEKEGE